MARRRAAPYILRLGGLAHGTGQYFGQLVHNKTTELRELQDIENLKKFADGDPETYLEYWKERQKTAKGKLKSELAAYAARAEKRVKRNAEDAQALASYARTNNHQAYLDHLLKRLDEETDPNLISKLGTQINELRSRVFSSSASSGAIGGGVTQDQFTSARDKWNETRLKYESIVKSRPITAMEYDELKGSAKEYETTLKRIIFSADATQTRKDAMNTQYLLKDGPNPDFIDSLGAKSDAKLLSKFKNDSDFAASIAPLVAAKNYGQIAKMYADRAQALSLLAHQALNTPGAEAIGNWLDDAEKNATKYAAQASQESTKLPASAQEKIDNEYSGYWSDLTEAKRKDSTLPAPKSKSDWLRQLKADKTAEQFSQDVGYPYSDATFTAIKKVATTFGPVTYNPAKNSYEGDPAAILNAQAADDAIRTLINTPGSEYEVFKKAGLTDPMSIRMIRDGALTPQIASIQAPLGGYPGETGQTEVVAPPPTEPAPLPQAGVAPIEGSPEQAAADIASATPSGGGKPGMLAVQPTDIEPDTYDAATAGINTFLTQYDYGDLPDFTPPKEPPVADFDSLFPFEGTPPQVNQPAERPTRSGQPY
jgi:hypothetical protein